MTPRDKAIISDLERFRCLTRDDIAEIHFSHSKKPEREANSVLLRLRRMCEIAVSKERRQYVYFPVKSIKRDSVKIPHFLAIAEFYRQARKVYDPKVFLVEPKVGGKGSPEPDIFMEWNRIPFFVEVQRKVYSKREWAEKMERYEKYYHSDVWKESEFHRGGKFPYVWIIGKGTKLDQSFKILQGSVEDIAKKFSTPQPSSGVMINVPGLTPARK
jgi:hypothetical protein